MIDEISEATLQRFLTKVDAVPKDHPGLQGLWQQLNDAFQQKDPISVLEYASDLIGVGCREVRIFYCIAWAHYRLFEFARAKRWLDFAMKMYPDDVSLKLLLADILIIEQNQADAIDLLATIKTEKIDEDDRNKLAELMQRATNRPISTFKRRLLN